MKSTPSAPVDAAQLQTALAEYFAPWVQALNLRAEAAVPGAVTLRLPHSPQLSRVGDMLCGQAGRSGKR
ncbi:hypothetical protein [Ramlibacter sp. 2FC]|uniref:hypothetical protein n=1 Tax=Ramlibacter sp. 2FC TaxID=2502188 RepID=UPI0010F9243D|nr:hypothetical protein [Ramlibacter sp. 2FC]